MHSKSSIQALGRRKKGISALYKALIFRRHNVGQKDKQTHVHNPALGLWKLKPWFICEQTMFLWFSKLRSD